MSPKPTSPKVWVAEADDRYYDAGSIWLIGIYTTEDLAKKAADKEEVEYLAKHTNSGDWDISTYVYEMEVISE